MACLRDKWAKNKKKHAKGETIKWSFRKVIDDRCDATRWFVHLFNTRLIICEETQRPREEGGGGEGQGFY